MAREPLVLGQLNDGSEPEYPTTDVPRILPLVQGLLGVELDRDMGGQVPSDWATTQHGSVGITVHPLLVVASTFVMPMSTWQKTPDNFAVVVRADYQGCSLSLISCKRPAPAHMQNWPEWDTNLASLVGRERGLGQIPAVGLDANQADPLSLAHLTSLVWHPPRDTSVVGFLFSTKIQVLATTAMTSTGEHPPVISMVRVPVS